MKAVILAAGKGTRMGKLTREIPKPMLKVKGKNLIEHKLDMLPGTIREVVIVIGYLGDAIVAYFGNEYKGRKITYAVQEELTGTGGALWAAKKHLNEPFLVLMGDDLYHESDIMDCLGYDRSILVTEVKGPASGGKVVFNDDGTLQDIIEGTHHDPTFFINAAVYVLGPEIFECELVQIPGKSEYGLPQTLLRALSQMKINVVRSRRLVQLSSPEDLVFAEKIIAL
jgi:UDP-N-acetylglucosamine diphosphorylase / glucose-1-phosphate thymidylyltransferase / UDP-N-acetylgalactosamine diphosphorylase / glucosamine-1-phosphate N-acetyltransferase / galactosamine-1-phosphate N-acetyltransferase